MIVYPPAIGISKYRGLHPGNRGTAMKKQSKLINLYNELFRGVGSI